MNKLYLAIILTVTLTFSLNAENNQTQENNTTSEHNSSKDRKHNKDTNQTKSELTQQQVKEQMEREKKYAKEQKFYQGDEYDLKAVEINKKSLENIPVIEPDYDFDITDVYRDDI